MRGNLLTLLFLLLIGAASKAQTPWQGFLPGRTAHYAVPPAGIFLAIDSLKAVYEVARFDSTSISGNSRFYYSMKVIGTEWWASSSLYNYPYPVNGPDVAWSGAVVRIDSLQEEYFPKQGGSLLRSSTRIRIGDTALYWQSGPENLFAVCTAVTAETVLTEPDSIAHITIFHTSLAGNPMGLNGKQLKLSRTHGWVQAINFYRMAEDTLYRNLAMLSASPVEYTYPAYQTFDAYQPGDVVQYSIYTYQDRLASCFGSTGGMGGTGTAQHHRRLLRREATPMGTALVWVDSTKATYHANGGPGPVEYPLYVDTLVEYLHELIDSSQIAGASFELKVGQTDNIVNCLPLGRVGERFVRLDFEGGISGMRGSSILNPFGVLYQFDNWSPQGMCRSSTIVVYATCNGDTIGTPDRFTAIRSELQQAHLLTISPNPTSGLATIQPTTGKPVIFQLIRADGAILQTQKIPSQIQLDLSHLPAGLYAWRAVQGNEVQTGRIVKE